MHSALTLISVIFIVVLQSAAENEWGTTLGDFKVGLHYSSPENQNWQNPTNFTEAWLIVTNVSSNHFRYFIPVGDQAFKIRLFDSAGKEVRPKWRYRNMGKKNLEPSLGLANKKRFGNLWPPKEKEFLFFSGMVNTHPIKITEMFEISKAGYYTFEYEARLFIWDGLNLKTVVFPPLKGNLKLRPP